MDNCTVTMEGKLYSNSQCVLISGVHIFPIHTNLEKIYPYLSQQNIFRNLKILIDKFVYICLNIDLV